MIRKSLFILKGKLNVDEKKKTFRERRQGETWKGKRIRNEKRSWSSDSFHRWEPICRERWRLRTPTEPEASEGRVWQWHGRCHWCILWCLMIQPLTPLLWYYVQTPVVWESIYWPRMEPQTLNTPPKNVWYHCFSNGWHVKCSSCAHFPCLSSMFKA